MNIAMTVSTHARTRTNLTISDAIVTVATTTEPEPYTVIHSDRS